MKKCDYCGERISPGDEVSAPNQIGVWHYSRITCAENLRQKLDDVQKDLAMTKLQATLALKLGLEAEADLVEERQEHKATAELFREAREQIETLKEQASAKNDLRAALNLSDFQNVRKTVAIDDMKLQVDVLEKDNAALREELKRMGGCTCGNTPYRWHNDECPKKDEEKAVRNICPTCGGEAKFEIIDGKRKACRLGVVQDWMKPKGTVNRVGVPQGKCPRCGKDVDNVINFCSEKRKCVHPGEYADSGRVFCTECKERLI